MTVLPKHRNSLGKDWAVRENDKCRGSTKEVTLFTLSSSCFFHGNSWSTCQSSSHWTVGSDKKTVKFTGKEGWIVRPTEK